MALITGTNQSDTIDLLSVSPGVVGGPATIGLDTVNAGNGDDNVSTGAGDDTIHGEKGNDIINAGSGNDFIDGGRGNDTIETGAGNDTVVLSKNGGIDTVTDFRSPNLTINFDDLPPLATDLPVPNGYEGLNWDNVFHTPIFDEATGTVVVGVAATFHEDGATITTAGADFTLTSMLALGIDNHGTGVSLTVTGWDDANPVPVASQTFTLGLHATLLNLDGFNSVDRITFNVTDIEGGGAIVALDDLTVAFETTQSQDVIQVGSQEVADGLLASAHDVAGGVALDYQGYHAVLLGQTAANVTADWFVVA
jgi:Ca2+-binding RTX toxin-like protein